MLRYRRITDDQIFKRAHYLRVILLGRSYRDADILLAMGRTYSFTQSQLLVPKFDFNSPILPSVTPYDRLLSHLSSLLRQYWSQRMTNTFPKFFMSLLLYLSDIIPIITITLFVADSYRHPSQKHN